jgi:hypothetical protein
LVLGASVLCSLLAAVGQSSAQVATVPPQLQAAIKKVRSDAEIVRRDEIDWKSCEPPERDQIVEADVFSWSKSAARFESVWTGD